MDDKEIRGAAVAALEAKRASMYGWLRGVTLSDAEVLDALSAANLLMTADALEAMELCARARDVRFGTPDYDNFLADAKSIGRRIREKREQEKGPRYVVDTTITGLLAVADTTFRRDQHQRYKFYGTESECRAVADALNKHAGEK